MTGSPKVISALMAACAAEINSRAQYLQDAAALENEGLPALAVELRKRADEEADHLAKFLARITFLNGSPALRIEPTVFCGDINSVLSNQAKLEAQASADYQAAAEQAELDSDYVTRDLFTEIEADEQEHLNYLEGEQNIIAKYGIEAYVAGYRAKGV